MEWMNDKCARIDHYDRVYCFWHKPCKTALEELSNKAHDFIGRVCLCIPIGVIKCTEKRRTRCEIVLNGREFYQMLAGKKGVNTVRPLSDICYESECVCVCYFVFRSKSPCTFNR